MANPKAQKPGRCPGPTLAELATKRHKLLERYRLRNQTPECLECARIHSQEKRRQTKALGVCKDCGQPAIPGQTRCETRAEKHRLSRRQWQAHRRALKALEKNANAGQTRSL